MTRFSYCWLLIFVAVLITDPAFPDSVISPLIPPAPGRSVAPGRLVLLLQISASGARLSLDNGEKPASGVPAIPEGVAKLSHLCYISLETDHPKIPSAVSCPLPDADPAQVCYNIGCAAFFKCCGERQED